MASDFSRWSFDPFRDFSAVLSQQGRVDTDSDRNEAVAIAARRIQAGSLDTLGQAVVPRETPQGFEIQVSGGQLSIGRGRMYVDGLLAENHGAGSFFFEPHLAELTGTQAVDYADQPYRPFLKQVSAVGEFFDSLLPEGGPHLAYLKVWQREVTSIVDPGLVEKALGVDTTSRAQTVWQVKLLENVGAGVTCQTPLEEIPAFLDAEPIAAGRLTSKTVDVPGDPDPCELPPSGGYKGRENQLYRIEIHRGGSLARGDRATFKWSRDNATVASRVTAIPALDRIVVTSTGRDPLLRFSSGDFVEITDDWLELAGKPGHMCRIRPVNGVDDATRTIVFDPPLSSGLFPVDAQKQTAPARNTRVRRWDQKHRVRKEDGSALIDLDTAGASGEIPVPNPGTFVVLEHGISVAFSLDPRNGRFRTGDHWLVAARTADASIEILDDAPPRGIHAHYAKLALVTFPDTETDCRVLWPPEAGERSCDCTACVSVESHANHTLSVHAAIEKVKQTGGTVCLGPGTYVLPEPIRIHGARSLRIRGQGQSTVLAAARGGPAVLVGDSVDVTLENLAVVSAATRGAMAAVVLRNTFGLTLRNALIFNAGLGDQTSVGIALEGHAFDMHIDRCAIGAEVGIEGGQRDDDYLLTSGLHITDNQFICALRGISFQGFAIHVGEARVTGNSIRGCRQLGIGAVGGVTRGGGFQIANNVLDVDGSGIVGGTDGLRIVENEIHAMRSELPGDGIALVRSLGRPRIDQAQILANRISGVRGHGIAIRTRLDAGMIKMNVIAGVAGGGIVMEAGGEAGQLVVENNQLLHIGGGNLRGLHSAAMRFVGTQDLDVRSNAIAGFARDAREGQARTAIQVIASARSRIAGNQVTGLAPADGFVGSATGIEVIAPFREASIEDNAVRRRGEIGEEIVPAAWTGIGIQGRVEISKADKRVGFTPLGDIALASVADRIFLFTGSGVHDLLAAEGEVALRGNDVESERSTSAPLRVMETRGCRLDGNRIALLPFDQPIDAHLASPSLVVSRHAIVSSNDLRGPGGPDAPVLRVDTSARGGVVVVGNLRSGVIQVDGAALGHPWDPLNPPSFI